MQRFLLGRRGLIPSIAILLLTLLPWSARPAVAGAFLWRVEGQRNSVYLLGAVHMLGAGDPTLPPPVEEAYRAAAKLVFETDLDELESAEFARRLVSASRLPAGTSLQDRLQPETYAKLRQVVEGVGLPLQAFRDQQPSMVAFSLVVPHLKRLGVDPELGVDAQLWRRAGADGKERAALETPEFQLSLLTGLPPALQEQLLLQTLDEMDVFSSNLATMLEQWRSGDVDGLTRLLQEGFLEYPEMERVFLTDRNRRWVTRIEGLTREPGDVLVVVGAGHLVGYDGVVELLRVLGHRVEQVP